MPEPLIQTMPQFMNLEGGYVVRINALDPTDGSQVTGVTVTNFTIYADNIGGGAAADLAVGPFMLVPGPGA